MKKKMIKNVVICAHFDDEVIGCSSLLNEETLVIVVCSQDKARKNIFLYLNKLYNFEYVFLNFMPFFLQYVKTDVFNKQISDILEKYPNTNIYTHSNDLHIDHRIINEAVTVASRPSRTNFKSLNYFDVDNFSENENTFRECENKVKNIEIYKKYINKNHKDLIIKRINYLKSKMNSEKIIEGFKTIYNKDFL